MSEERVKFSELSHFTPKQLEANKLLNQFKFLLYGGAMSGGKSYWLRWALLKLLLRSGKDGLRNVRAALFCEDYPTLKDRHLSKITLEFPEWLGRYNTTDHEFVLAPEYGSGVICFRNLDDPSKYQSSEFAFIGVDELTKNPKNTFDFLRTRLRWPGLDDVKFLAATNPGDIGHVWVKKLFIDKEYDFEEKEADKFAFIQALADDNPYISPSYLLTLDSLPMELQKAFRHGDWNIFKGQFFSDYSKMKMGRPYHVISSYTPTKFDSIFASADWGFDPDSFSFTLHAVTKVSGVNYSFDRIISFAQLYGKKKYPDEWAGLIKELEQGLKVQARYIDPSAGNRHPISTRKEGAGTSVIDEFRRNGIDFIPANNDRKQGYESMRNWLREAPDGLPYWQQTEACQALIKQIPSAIHDPNNSFLIKEGGEDHAIADSRYFVVSRPFNYLPQVERKEIPEMSMVAIKERIKNETGAGLSLAIRR